VAWTSKMATVPMRFLVLAFPDGNISDEIAPELVDLVDKKVIRILDIVFIAKQAAGDVSILEFDELGNLVGFAETDGEVDGLIGPDDLDLVGSELEPGAAAAVLLVEDLWAAPLAGALDRSGGVLLAGARVPGDLLLAEITELG
jgi:Family of unknown function (DUF6325)